MRIISGKFRSRSIKRPPGVLTRPTKDRVREAVFNTVAEYVNSSFFLDLFAGSGAFGFEALSRGAKRVFMVESEPEVVSTIQDNFTSLGRPSGVKIVQEDVFVALKALKAENICFDLIFADPPYKHGLVRKTLNMINHYDILSATGICMIEHSAEETVPERTGDIILCKQKSYKNIQISYLRKE